MAPHSVLAGYGSYSGRNKRIHSEGVDERTSLSGEADRDKGLILRRWRHRESQTMILNEPEVYLDS